MKPFKRMLKLFALLQIILSGAVNPYAQQKQLPNAVTQSSRLTLSDINRLEAIAELQLSPDTSRIAYVLSSVDAMTDRAVHHLFVMSTRDRQARAVRVEDPGSPAWSPDSSHLAIVNRSKDGQAVLTILQADALTVKHEYALSSSPEHLTWSPDQKSIAFTMFVTEKNESVLSKAVTKALRDLNSPSGATLAPKVEITQLDRYRQDGGTWLTSGHNQLFVVSVDSDEVRQVDNSVFDDNDPSWLPDSAGLLFTSARDPDNTSSSIFKLDLRSSTLTQLTHKEGSFYSPVSSPDGQWIAYNGYPFRPVNYTQSLLYVMRLDGSKAHPLSKDLDRDISGIHWSRDGSAIYARYDDHGVGKLDRWNLQGKRKEVASKIFGPYSVAQDSIAYVTSSSSDPSQILFMDHMKATTQLTTLNDFLKDKDLGRLQPLQTTSRADGTPVEGWALLPADVPQGTKLPTILAIHGGPFGADGPDWSTKFQLYAAAGYAVVYANYRGSITYGAAFSEPANHDFPGVAYDDLMSVMDQAIAVGFVDPKRCFVVGGSAGGELTLWITGKTGRFRAAVAEKPVVDQLSNFLTSDQYLFFRGGGQSNLWDQQETLWKHSPLSLANSMKTPTMLIVGEEDFRTPLEQTLEIYDALQLRKIPSALVRIPRVGHENMSSHPSQMAAEIAATLAWFQQYDRK